VFNVNTVNCVRAELVAVNDGGDIVLPFWQTSTVEVLDADSNYDPVAVITGDRPEKLKRDASKKKVIKTVNWLIENAVFNS